MNDGDRKAEDLCLHGGDGGGEGAHGSRQSSPRQQKHGVKGGYKVAKPAPAGCGGGGGGDDSGHQAQKRAGDLVNQASPAGKNAESGRRGRRHVVVVVVVVVVAVSSSSSAAAAAVSVSESA